MPATAVRESVVLVAITPSKRWRSSVSAIDLICSSSRSGRDLQRERHQLAVQVGEALLLVLQRGEQRVEFARALQLAQVLRVRRRDVDRHVARERIHAFEAVQIVFGGALDRRVGVLADVQAERCRDSARPARS